MKQHRTLLGALTAALIFGSSPALAATGEGNVVKMELKPEKEQATLVLSHTGSAKFRLFKSAKRASVILEAENLVLPPMLTKLVDVSAAGGPVLQMTPYNSTHGERPMAKLILQLRGDADVSGSEGPNRFVVKITRKPGGLAAALRSLEKGSTATDEVSAKQAANAKSEEVAKRLIEVLNAPQEDKKYFGSKVTFEAKDAEVPDIFRLVGESSELNIIWDPDVEGAKTSLAVKDLPWDQLLDIVIQQKGYKAVVMGNVVRIMTIATFNAQAKARKEEISISDELEPVVMAVVPLSFAEAKDMKTMIDQLIQQKTSTGAGATSVSGGGGGGGGGSDGGDAKIGQDFKRGKIEVDSRTNSLVITNTKDAIERIRRLVRELDVAVPQILIDSKIVVASEDFERTINVRWQNKFNQAGDPALLNGFGGAETNTTDNIGTNFAVNSVANSVGIGFLFGNKGGDVKLAAALNLSETNNTSKTIASPRVIVNNNTKAEISDGTSITKSTVQGNTSGTTTVSAELKLSLTPQVTSRGSVQLKALTVERGLPKITGDDIQVDKKRVATEVLVDSGATLVLGGVFQMDRTVTTGGIPFLKDLPFIGWFFRQEGNTDNKSELMVFITPQIIDPEGTSQSL